MMKGSSNSDTRDFYAPSDDDRTDYLLMADQSVRYSGGYDHMCHEYQRPGKAPSDAPLERRGGIMEASSYDDERSYRLNHFEGQRPNFRELRWRPNVKQTDTAPIPDWDEWYERDHEVNRCIVKMPYRGGGGRKKNVDMENMYSTIPLIWQWQQPDYHMPLDVTDSSAPSRTESRKRGDLYMKRNVV